MIGKYISSKIRPSKRLKTVACPHCGKVYLLASGKLINVRDTDMTCSNCNKSFGESSIVGPRGTFF